MSAGIASRLVVAKACDHYLLALARISVIMFARCFYTNVFWLQTLRLMAEVRDLVGLWHDSCPALLLHPKQVMHVELHLLSGKQRVRGLEGSITSTVALIARLPCQ